MEIIWLFIKFGTDFDINAEWAELGRTLTSVLRNMQGKQLYKGDFFKTIRHLIHNVYKLLLQLKFSVL